MKMDEEFVENVEEKRFILRNIVRDMVLELEEDVKLLWRDLVRLEMYLSELWGLE